MYFRCQILINGISYEATDDLKNWDDFELAYKRSSYDGVIRSFSTSFDFVNRSYNLLKEEFYKNYLSSKAGIVFYKRNNSWNWDEVFRCALDFSTYSEDGSVVSINAIDNTLAAIIKAKKSIQYEYLVADLETSTLKYDGLNMKSMYNFTMGDYVRMYPGSYATNMYIYSYSNEIIKPYLEPDTGEIYVVAIVEGVPYSGLNVVFDVDISLVDPGISGWRCAGYFHITMHGLGHDYVQRVNKGGIQRVRFEFTITQSNFDSSSDKKLYLNLKDFDWGDGNRVLADIYINKINEFTISYKDRRSPVNIDVISPNTILSKLLDSMTENTIDHKGVIDVVLPSDDGITPIKFNRLLDRTYIMAAESARGLPKAKIYTSYKKFCEWMEAEFGYVPVINENTVTFRHRDKLFSSTVVKDLGTEINGYELTVNDSLIYSSVKVGYDKQDYDSINGRDEFRFTNEFSTGLKLTDNTLSLISPYRADAYGIEFLVQKRGEDTTDNDSDNDVFFVECDDSVPVDQPLPLYRPYTEDQLSGLLSPDTMFNLNYSPRFMLEANKKYIGACTNLLKFASSDGNSDVSIAGVKETDDFSIPERLFTVSEVEIETSDIGVPNDLAGLISFENKGETITGYIKQLKINIGKEQATSYSLIVKNVET